MGPESGICLQSTNFLHYFKIPAPESVTLAFFNRCSLPGVFFVPLIIGDEVVDYRGGDDEAYVLRILVLERLEGYADALTLYFK